MTGARDPTEVLFSAPDLEEREPSLPPRPPASDRKTGDDDWLAYVLIEPVLRPDRDRWLTLTAAAICGVAASVLALGAAFVF
jgi:hypothetical protein